MRQLFTMLCLTLALPALLAVGTTGCQKKKKSKPFCVRLADRAERCTDKLKAKADLSKKETIKLCKKAKSQLPAIYEHFERCMKKDGCKSFYSCMKKTGN